MTKALRYEPATFPLTTVRGSSATYIDSDGLLKEAGVDEPRREHDPITGEPLGLLVEEQRTNLCPYSEDFTQARQSGVTIEPFTSIFGTTNSAVYAADGTTKYAFYDVPFTAGVEYVLTAYVIMDDGGAPSFGSVSGSRPTNSLAVIIANGSASELPTAELVNADLNIYKVTGKRTSPITGNESAGIYKYSSNDSRGFRLLALQVEQGSFPTSYIKTEGSQVTREADSYSRTLGAEFNPNQTTLFASVVVDFAPNISFFATLGNSFVTRTVQFVRRSNGNIASQFIDGTGQIHSAEVPYVASQTYYFAASYSESGFVIAVNGVSASGPQTNNSDPVLAWIGSDPVGRVEVIVKFKDFRLIPRALSESELKELTQP